MQWLSSMKEGYLWEEHKTSANAANLQLTQTVLQLMTQAKHLKQNNNNPIR